MFPTNHAAPLLDNAVLFLFAHQRLVFRYPLSNPFEVTASPSSGGNHAGGTASGPAAPPTQPTAATAAGTPSSASQQASSVAGGEEATPHAAAAVPTITVSDGSGAPAAPTSLQHTMLTAPGAANTPLQSVSAATPHAVMPAPLANAMVANVPSSVAKMPSCVGFDTGTMMFLLRNSFSRMTTLRIGLCSLLIWPLLNVKGEAMLVLALRDPDDAYAHVSRYMQVYVNILLREEQRCQYVTHYIDAMLSDLDLAGGPLPTGHAASGVGSLAGVPSAASPVVPHLKKNRLGCLTSSTTYPSGSGDASALSTTSVAASPMPPLTATGVPELDVFARASQCASGLFLEMRLVAETVNGAYHDDIVVNQLLVLPHSHLSGQVRHRRQVLASFSSRYDSGAIVTIADATFADTRRRQYEHVVGRQIAALMPLDDVHRTFQKMSPPWTLFAARAALEAYLVERMTSSPDASAAMLADADATMDGGPAAAATGREGIAMSPNDAPFVIFEVMEFLRLFGAVTFHVQRICFTRGFLAPAPPPGRNSGSGFVSGCIFGSTCNECSAASDSTGGGPNTPTTPHDETKAAHAAGHQALLYRHYNAVYDDPWFLASEVEHRANESALVAGNRHPAVRVYERSYEVAPPPPASHAQLLKKSSSSMLDASLSGGDIPTPKAAANAANPASTSTGGGGLYDVADVHPSAAQWLRRHGAEIQRRINTAEGFPTQTSKGHQQQRAAPIGLIASLEPDAIDSRGSLTRRRFQQQQHHLSSGRGGCGSGVAADDGMLPTGVLLQVVVHVAIALLWRGNPQDGSPMGEPLSFDDVVGRVELTMRRLAPMLRNMAYVRRRIDALSHYHHAAGGGGGATIGLDDGPLPAATKPVSPVVPPMPLTLVEQKIVAFADVVGALQLTQLVAPHYGREIRRIPCRALVHAAVNLLPDVLSVGVFPSNLPSAAAI